jgi:formylmethanofuran dehydrogenase subunit B
MSTVTEPDKKVVEDATCTFCGCLCDDIAVSVDGDRITEAANACALGEAWFLSQRGKQAPVCLIEGKPGALDDGIERAAQILSRARYPVVIILDQTTSEAHRAAVSIGDRIGACVDHSSSDARGPGALAVQEVGEVTCTLGEVKNRGDLIIYWRCNPVDSDPRHMSRYSLDSPGRFLPRGRADRYCVVVGVEETATSRVADRSIIIKVGKEFESLWTLRALAKGVELDATVVERETGVALSTWQELMDRMKRAAYGVIFSGTHPTTPFDSHQTAHAVFALVRDMNAWSRFVCLPLTRMGNGYGAEAVLTWQTGYPFGVSLARGYPRFGPGEFTADAVLGRGEADAALVIGGDPRWNLSPEASVHLAEIPTVALDASDIDTISYANVGFLTATYGIHTGGTVYRADGVAIPLRPSLSTSRPSDLEILTRIDRRIREQTAAHDQQKNGSAIL